MRHHQSYIIGSILALLLCFGIRAGNCSACIFIPSFSKECASFDGVYENYAWGYSVVIPKGMTGRSGPPDYPQHGFGLILSKQPAVYIIVDGSANSLEWASPDAAADQEIELVSEKAERIFSVERYTDKIGELPAVRLIVTYKCPESDATIIQDEFFAIDTGRERDVVYAISLESDASMYDEYKKTLEDIVHSFRLIPRE